MQPFLEAGYFRRRPTEATTKPRPSKPRDVGSGTDVTVSEIPSVPIEAVVKIDSSATPTIAPRVRVEISCGAAFRVKDSKGSSSVVSKKSTKLNRPK